MIKEKRIRMLKNITIILFIFILINNIFISTFNQTVYGATNSLWNVDDADIENNKLEENIKDNFLISLVGSFVYSVTSIFEGLVSGIVELLTGTNTFPWADKVVFNTMPILDINFINPANGSLFYANKGTTAIGKIVGNIYYTVFTIAVAFLGVCVGIMALRLIFASIASEKAKYKQAITQWLMAMLMLFLAHYLISFIFFINEKMVEVASSMLSKSTETLSEESIDIKTVSDEDKRKLVKNMVEDEKNSNIFDFGISLAINTNPVGGVINYIRGLDETISWVKIKIENFNSSAGDLLNDKSKLYSDRYLDYAYYLITDRYYVKKVLPSVYNSGGEWYDKILHGLVNTFTSADKHQIASFALDVAFLDSIGQVSTTEANDQISEYVKTARGNKEYLKNILLSVWERKWYGQESVKGNDIFTGLGQYFKDIAWTYKTDNNDNIVGWKAGQNSIVGTLLYAIFVVQSIMLFISYMKRFFYIIILSLFAPLVVVFDFFSKTMK